MKYFVLFSVLFFSSTTWSADTDGTDNASNDMAEQMQQSRELIADGQYQSAIKKLKAITRQDNRNANAWNLLGYSQRNVGEFRQAKKSYSKALKYNPEHLGALEYQGELFILLEDFQGARANHAKLKELCKSGCEELIDLSEALKDVGQLPE